MEKKTSDITGVFCVLFQSIKETKNDAWILKKERCGLRIYRLKIYMHKSGWLTARSILCRFLSKENMWKNDDWYRTPYTTWALINRQQKWIHQYTNTPIENQAFNISHSKHYFFFWIKAKPSFTWLRLSFNSFHLLICMWFDHS